MFGLLSMALFSKTEEGIRLLFGRLVFEFFLAVWDLDLGAFPPAAISAIPLS
jgi:hypothetical protein